MHRLYVLAGPSGVGKSTLLARLEREGLCVSAPKYAERPKRLGVEDVINVPSVSDPGLACDITYELYGVRYGISSAEILDGLALRNHAIVVSDIHALRELRSILGSKMIAVYVLPAEDSIQRLISAYTARGELKLSQDQERDLSSLAADLQDAASLAPHDRQCEEERLRQRMASLFADAVQYRSFMERFASLTKARENYTRHRWLFDCVLRWNENPYERLRILMSE